MSAFKEPVKWPDPEYSFNDIGLDTFPLICALCLNSGLLEDNNMLLAVVLMMNCSEVFVLSVTAHQRGNN